MIPTTWLGKVAATWAGGQADQCSVEDHPREHATVVADAWFMGDHVMPIEIFDWRRYDGMPGYCPGNDDVSKSIGEQGDYERPESKMVREILTENEARRAVVLDIGSHVGWYSMIAALLGYEVLALDADEEHLRLLHANARRLGVEDRVHTVRGWFGPKTPEIPLTGARHVRFVKADIEGLENHIPRVFAPMLERGLVDYLLVEISPVLADHYSDTVEDLLQYGYTGFVVPGSADEDLWGDRLDEHVKSVRDRVASWHQHNVMFVRNGLL